MSMTYCLRVAAMRTRPDSCQARSVMISSESAWLEKTARGLSSPTRQMEISPSESPRARMVAFALSCSNISGLKATLVIGHEGPMKVLVSARSRSSRNAAGRILSSREGTAKAVQSGDQLIILFKLVIGGIDLVKFKSFYFSGSQDRLL
jgi:hypothetical protein